MLVAAKVDSLKNSPSNSLRLQIGKMDGGFNPVSAVVGAASAPAATLLPYWGAIYSATIAGALEKLYSWEGLSEQTRREVTAGVQRFGPALGLTSHSKSLHCQIGVDTIHAIRNKK